MNNKIIAAAIGFIAGVGTGFAANYILMKKKNEKQISEEVESIKNTYEKINNLDAPNKDKGVEAKIVNPAVPDGGSTNKDEEGDTDASKDEDEEPPANYIFEDDSNEDYGGEPNDEEEEEEELSEYKQIVKQYINDPTAVVYNITREDYEETAIDFEKREVTYYDTDEPTVIDIDTGHELEDWRYILGFEEGCLADKMFEEYSGMTFIRNDAYGMDFLVNYSNLEV